ncbi:MAG: integrin alpha, partial [Planctomycetes bacterium]|nr:integrin alpha [Planctomycetota bacterium]
MRGVWAALASLMVAAQLGGCPSEVAPLEFVAGGTGETTILRSTPEVEVLTPVSDLSISGGTQVEVNWRAFARTRTSVLNVIVDEDQDPNNANEIVAFSNLSLTTTNALVDTTTLEKGTYYVGVVLVEIGEIAAFGYAPGRITIDQRPALYFNEPADTSKFGARGNLAFDRTEAVTPKFEIAWTLSDPDSTDEVDIYLDPDDQPNGNEVLLFHSASQTGDSFEFDLPTMEFEAGTYRILALVTDGQNQFSFYAPGRILLRSRLAGFYDLRDLALGGERLSGAVFEGFNPRDNTGSFIRTTGDLDGDGFADFIIVAQFAKPRYTYNAQRTGVGEAYLIYGRQKRFTGAISLNSTGSLFRGEVYTGPPEAPDPIRPSRGVTSFAMLTDWDFDGVREMAFGLPFTDSVSIGGFILGPAVDNYAPLDANGYFRTGVVVVAAGSSLRPDLGFPGRNVFNLAEFGTIAHMGLTCTSCVPPEPCPCDEGFENPKAPSSPFGCASTYYHQHIVGVAGGPNIGSVRLGCRFSSVDFGDQFGETVSTWDFDGIVMAAPNRDPQVSVLTAPSIAGGGVISVFFNDVKEGFYPWTNDQGPGANTDTGYPGSAQSSGAGFLPHGGPYHYIMDDLVYSPGYYVDNGDSEPCQRWVDARIVTPERSVRFWSSARGARLSNTRGIRNVNGDGLLDLMIGAPQANAGAGACYLVLGRLRELVQGGALQLEELSLPMNSTDSATRRLFDGIQIVGNPGERLGQAQDDAGDFNGDGFGDVVIGSPLLNNGQG